MKINFSEEFLFNLEDQVRYIAKDKSIAYKKFKKELLSNLLIDLKNPFFFKKSIYYDDFNIRDYVFKGYTIVYVVDMENQSVVVFGFIKFKNSI